MITIKNNTTDETYQAKNELGINGTHAYNSREVNRMVRAGIAVLADDVFARAKRVDEGHNNIIIAKPVSQPTQATRWQDEPATAKQIAYLNRLGYYPKGRYTKGDMSRMIDAAKNGWAGSLNMERCDGSY